MNQRAMTATVATILMASSAAFAAEGQTDTDSYKWPKYSNLRFTENYAGLANLAAIPERDGFDALKYIPLDDEGDWWVSFGGQARWRYENYQNFNFGRPVKNDDDYLLQRYFLHADVHAGENLRFFTELRSAFINGYDLTNANHPRPVGMHDEFDFINLFGDLTLDVGDNNKLRTRVGRWEMNYGVGRMVGCRNFSQLRRSFDGVALRYSGDRGWVDGFYANWVRTPKYDPFNSTNDDISNWGVYGHLDQQANGLPFNLEPYFFGKENKTGTKDEQRATIGARIFGKIDDSRWSYDVEGGYQFDYGGTDVSAGFFSAEATYTLDDKSAAPWVTVGFDWASGDDDPSDDKIKTFEPVSAFGHYYFGYADHIGRQNIVSPWVRVGAKPAKKLTTTAELHWFWADESADGVYSPCNCSSVMRPGAAGADSFIGTELDLVAKYKFNHHTVGLFGYSYLWAGDYIDDTGAGTDDVQRFYAQLQFTF